MTKFFNIFKNAVTHKAEAMARTISSDPLQAFMFRVSISGLPEIGFQKVGGLSREVAVVEYLESCYEHAHKLPGRETLGEITFERGMYSDSYLRDTYESIFHNDTCRSTTVIQIMDRQGRVAKTLQLGECWFSKYEIADLDATSDDVIIETLTMQYETVLG